MNMDGLKRRKSNLSLSTESKNYSGSDKNTLKSRIHAMDKGWIEKKKEIKGMNRIKGNIMEGI
jgi:hypothetical protein